MGVTAIALLATTLSGEPDQPARAWDDPERARPVPNLLVWSSTRTLINLGYSATVWEKPFGAMYIAFSFGAVGPDAPRRYQVGAPELGVKLGSPRVWVSAGWGVGAGNHLGTGGHSRYGMNMKLLLGVQPLRHLGFIAGMGTFSPIGTWRDDNEQTFTIEGILGVQLGF